MEEEEIFARMAKSIIKSMAMSRLKSRPLSKKFAEAKNKEEIEKDIERVSEEITKKFLIALKKKSAFGDVSEEEFRKILDKVIKDYFGDLTEDKDKTQ